jgi:putative flavoprotein involved in K+ transport
MTDVTRRVERFELVIIGGGQAGLAAGYWLSRQDIDYVILDANERVGDSWRKRWDSLRLFTPARYSGLPGLPFPAAPYHLPTRNEMADYLEWYASTFELPLRPGVRVTRLARTGALFELSTNHGTFEAQNVIVATGAFQQPRIPEFAKDIDPEIRQLHSKDYRSADQLPDGDVLVVGAGNSGAQIALELSATRNVVLSGRSVGGMPRRLLGRDVFDWLWHTVMRPGADTMLGRRIRKSVLSSSDALIGMTEQDLARAGITRAGRVTGARNGQPMLEAGSVSRARSVIWCTGYRPDFSWIDAPVITPGGSPEHVRGVTSVPGLYFLGLRFLHRLNSSLVGGVGADARQVAKVLAARYGHTRETRAPLDFSGRPTGAYT